MFDAPPLDGLRLWLEATAISQFMNWSWWAWPVNESLHFVGLTLLFGTVGVFDLRLLGLLPRARPADVERLVPWGIGGFCLSFATGCLFFTGIPGMYLNNPAFWAKGCLLLLAGANVLLYTLFVRERVAAQQEGARPLLAARVTGAASLILWVAVLIAGRLIAFYKP